MLHSIFPGKKIIIWYTSFFLVTLLHLPSRTLASVVFLLLSGVLSTVFFVDPFNSPQFCSIGGTTRAKSNAPCPSTFSLFIVSFSSLILYAIEVKWSESHSVVSDFATPGTVASQAPLSMRFPMQEGWSEFSWPRDWTCVFGIGRWFLYCWATGEFREDCSGTSMFWKVGLGSVYLVLNHPESCWVWVNVSNTQEWMPLVW